jgi:DNA-binding SARP family transcriptional activator
MRSTLLRLPSLLAASVAVGALAALARFRPEFPETPDSLSSPVTTAFLQGLALIAAWVLAALVVLRLLVESLRVIRASWHASVDGPNLPATTREPSRLRRPASTHGLIRPLIDQPRLLVVTPPDAEPAPAEEQGDGSSSKPAAGRVAEPDPRPLISLLGPLTIQGGKRSRRGLRARALELIAFLALRGEGAQRDEILEALWPGEDPKRSRHRLYQAVRDARRLLGEAVASERDRYWLDRGRVRVDVDELDQLLARAGRGDAHARLQIREQALALFRDEPLAASDFPWCEGEIRRLRGTYVELLEHVGRARLEAGDPRRALEAAERGLAADLLNEVLWRLALEAEGRLGLRQAIEVRYERLRRMLGDRLGLEPAQETRALYFDLLGQS